MKDIEIEIQVKLRGVDKLESFLAKKGKFTGDNYQKDGYYIPAHKNYLEAKPVTEWLRLRESTKNSITYKKWHYDKSGKSQYSDEFETIIEDIDQLRKIFNSLGFKLITTVEKKRKTWNYQDYEVAIDHITGLGDFVEVEYKGKTLATSPEAITGQMVELLKSVGCSEIRRNYVGYPFMLLFPDDVKFYDV